MAQPWRNGGASLPQEELLTMNESTRQIAAAYRRMAAEARYRPAAPSDGLGGITVPVEQLGLDAEAIRYARNWWAEMGLEAQNHAAAIKLQAERMAGEMLRELERGQTDALKQGSRRPSLDNGPSPYAATLDAAGVTRQDAGRPQVRDIVGAAVGEAA
jgi:hypothetical protein